MSRYYDITITPQAAAPQAPGTSITVQLGQLNLGVTTYSSFPGGTYDPGALNVEFDFFSFQSKDSQGLSTISIHGVPLSDLFQAVQFTGSYITVKAGMQAGLPLARPEQAGIILQGQIWQSFGNWVGTEQTLDLVVNFSDYSFTEPGNFVLNWPKGTSLAAALAACLNVAFPTLQPVLAISDAYVLGYDVHHAVNTLPQLSRFVNSLTKSIRAPGVEIAILPNKTIAVFDGSVPSSSPKQIDFIDLIGQPTWIDIATMQFTTVMRADIQVGSTILMPEGLFYGPGSVTTNAGSNPLNQLKYQSAFKGPFIINAVRFVGNYRDPNGTSWVSIFRCQPTKIESA